MPKIWSCSCSKLNITQLNVTNLTTEILPESTTMVRETTTTTTATDTTNTKEAPLIFDIPEVPNEIYGVFHKPTGLVNYTALLEFVKAMKMNTSST